MDYTNINLVQSIADTFSYASDAFMLGCIGIALLVAAICKLAEVTE